MELGASCRRYVLYVVEVGINILRKIQAHSCPPKGWSAAGVGSGILMRIPKYTIVYYSKIFNIVSKVISFKWDSLRCYRFQDFKDLSRFHHRISLFYSKRSLTPIVLDPPNYQFSFRFTPTPPHPTRAFQTFQALTVRTSLLIPNYRTSISCFLLNIGPILPKFHSCSLVDIDIISRIHEFSLDVSSSLFGRGHFQSSQHFESSEFWGYVKRTFFNSIL